MIYSKVTKEDVKDAIAGISQLKYELQTNKELTYLDGEGNFESFLKSLTIINKSKVSFELIINKQKSQNKSLNRGYWNESKFLFKQTDNKFYETKEKHF